MSDLAFIFPGQGVQSVGMAREFYDNFNYCKEIFERASDILSVDFKKLCFEGFAQDESHFIQSAIFLSSFVAHEVFIKESDLKARFALGHSLGEVSAVCIAGGFSFENALKFTHIRSKLMSKIEGGMLVVLGLEDAILEDFCAKKRDGGAKIFVANYNAPLQVVLAGKKQDLEGLEAELKGLGAKRAQLLNVPVASHCEMLNEITDEIKDALNLLLTSDLGTNVISNVTTKAYSKKAEAQDNLKEALIKPVLYKQSILAHEGEASAFVEFGGSVLGGLNKRITKKPTISIQDIKSLKIALEELK